MISAITPEPPVSGTNNFSGYRYRPAMSERLMLPDSTPAAPKNSKSGDDDGRFPQGEGQQPAQPEPPQKDSSSIFVAAVIAGALSPTPQTMEQLMLRIGTSPIPVESEARLKDLMV